MVGDNRRVFRQNDRDLVRNQLAAIERAKFGKCAGRAAIALAEIVLAAGIELHIGGQHAAVFLQEADEAAVMIEVAMAHDHCIDLAGIGAGQFDIVEQSFRRIAEVEHDSALLIAAL